MSVKLKVKQYYPSVGIVLNYGITQMNDNAGCRIRTVTEMNGLYIYYESITKYLTKHNIGSVIFTGGFTNLKFQNLSESRTAAEFVNYNFSHNWQGKTYIEEKTSKGFEAFYYSFLELKDIIDGNLDDVRNYPVYFFCDTPRRTKTKILAFLYFGMTKLPYKVVYFDRGDIHPRSNFFDQNLSLVKIIFNQFFWKKVIEVRRLLK